MTNQRSQRIAAYVLIALAIALLLSLLLIRPANAATIPISTGLQACWDFNESGGVRYDSYGSNHLTDNNTVGFSGTGLLGQSANFISANSESLSVNDNEYISLAVTNWSVIVWYKLPSISNAPIWQKQLEFSLRLVNTVQGAYFWGNTATSQGFQVTTDTSLWHMVVVTWDGTTQRIYHDNGIMSITQTSFADTANPLRFGSLTIAGTTYLTGDLDQPALWHRTLSASEVIWLYNGRLGRTCSEIITAGAPQATESEYYVQLSDGKLLVNRQISYGDIAIVAASALLLLIFAIHYLTSTIQKGLP